MSDNNNDSKKNTPDVELTPLPRTAPLVRRLLLAGALAGSLGIAACGDDDAPTPDFQGPNDAFIGDTSFDFPGPNDAFVPDSTIDSQPPADALPFDSTVDGGPDADGGSDQGG